MKFEPPVIAEHVCSDSVLFEALIRSQEMDRNGSFVVNHTVVDHCQ